MAQSISFYSPAKPRQQMAAESLAVSVSNVGSTVLLAIPCLGLKRLFVQFTVATNALAAFNILAKATPDSAYTTLYSSAADYTTPKGILVGTSGDLTSVASAGSGWFILDVSALAFVEVTATGSNATASVVSAYAGGA